VLHLQPAKQERGGVLPGQARALPVQHGLKLPPRRFTRGSFPRPIGGPALVFSPPGRTSFGFHGDAVSDSVKPARQRLLLADGGSVLGQDEEGRLASVFSVLLVPQYVPANA